MNKSKLRIFGLLVAFSIILFHLPLYAAPGGKQNPPPPVQVTGYPQVVVVSGTNFDMGYQYGQQAAPLIYQNRQQMRSNLEKILTAEVVDKDIQVWGYYLEKYDPKLEGWLKGISAGCKSKGFDVSYSDLVLMVIYPEELWARPDKPYPTETGVKTKNVTKSISQPANMCSSFATDGTATPDQKAVVTITAGADEEVITQVILIAFPSEGNSFIAFPFAGEVTSNQAMSSKFSWVEPAAPTWDPVWGIAPEVYFHWITQYASSVDDAINFLETTPRAGVTGNFLFAEQTEGEPGRIKALEANAQHYAERNPGNPGEAPNFLIMVNHFVDPSMTPYNGWSGWPMPPDNDNYFRYATLWQWLTPAAQTNSVNLDFIKSVWRMSDWYDFNTSTWHYNDPGSWNVPGNGARQHLHIYYPADKTAYIQYGYAKGLGTVPYGTGEYTKFQLLESPLAVTEQAARDAENFCENANTRYYTLVNAGSLTDPFFKQEIENLLNEGDLAIHDGLTFEANAYYAKKTNGQMALYGSAVTSYSKAQLKCQMVSTRLAPY